MARCRVVIAGASGFAGAELLRRLLVHPHVDVIRVCADEHVGELVSKAHPHLEGQSRLRFENPPAAGVAEGAELVIMGLPHHVSLELVDAALERGARVLDLSGAFRLQSAAAFARVYGGVHRRPDLLAQFVYGLPEVNRRRIANCRLLASPGCFATAIQLGLLPLARRGWLAGEIQSVGITGSSGSGVKPMATTHHPVRANNLRTYRPLEHAHAPEVEEGLRAAGAAEIALRFVPVSAPLTRGIFATSFAYVPAEVTPLDLAAAFHESCEHEPFLRMPEGRLPEVVAVSGSNFAEIGFVAAEPAGGRRLVTCYSALDNLIKGGAGQAVQNLNLMLGCDETTTLSDVGGYP